MMSASPKLEPVSVSGLRRRSVVVPTDVLLVSDYGPSFCTYSPSCLEEVFSETPGFRHYVFSETRYSPGPIDISQACAFHSGFPQPFLVERVVRKARSPLRRRGGLIRGEHPGRPDASAKQFAYSAGLFFDAVG